MLNPIPELTPLLKQLRLSGMTDSLAIRNREAIEHQLSYPDFLALLVQDEVARRDQKKYATRLRRAGFRGNKTLESFDLNTNPNLNRAYINELADCRPVRHRQKSSGTSYRALCCAKRHRCTVLHPGETSCELACSQSHEHL